MCPSGVFFNPSLLLFVFVRCGFSRVRRGSLQGFTSTICLEGRVAIQRQQFFFILCSYISPFVRQSNVSVETFLELLALYLESTAVGIGDELFVQKTGVCIGSSVAPVLSDIFLSGVDRAIQDCLSDSVKIFRYVDDYLEFLEERNIRKRPIVFSDNLARKV